MIRYAGAAGVAAATASVSGCLSGEETRTLVDGDGEQVSLTMVYADHTGLLDVAGRSMAANLETHLGIDVETRPVPVTALVQHYVQQVDGEGTPLGFNAGDRNEFVSSREWDLLWGLGFNTYPRSPQATRSLVTADGDVNFFGYEPTADLGGQLVEAAQTADPDERKERFSAVFAQLSEELPVNFVQYELEIEGYRDVVVHTEEPSLEGVGWGHQFQTWYFEDGYDGETYSTDAGGDVQSMSVYQIDDDISERVARAVLDGAYTFTPRGEFRGRWFESIESDEDGTRYECRLRDGLAWSEPYGQMTAEDWVYFVEHVVTNADDAGQPENWAGHVGFGRWWIDGDPVRAEVIDELTFRLELPVANHTFAYEPLLWEARILPKALTEPYFEAYLDGEDGATLHEDEAVRNYEYTGNLGPYRLVERRVEDRIVFERNDEYYMREHGGDEWAGAPHFETYVVDVIHEEASRLTQLEVGTLTSASLPVDEAERFDALDDVSVVRNASPYCRLLAFNQRANGWAPLRTTEIRQALAYAIDKEAIVEDVYRGNTQVAHTFQPEWSTYYDDSAVVGYGEGESHDPARARSLLERHLPGEYGFE